MSDRIEVRVRYAETDKMGYVYYANYLEYFEMARTEYIRERGKSYRQVEREGYLLPVTEAWTKYFKPAGYDDLLTIETEVSSVGRASMEFHYIVKNEGGETLAEGRTKHAFINKKGKITQLPEDIRRKLLTPKKEV
jgi:acyl-CoA thioester hydrolase